MTVWYDSIIRNDPSWPGLPPSGSSDFQTASPSVTSGHLRNDLSLKSLHLSSMLLVLWPHLPVTAVGRPSVAFVVQALGSWHHSHPPSFRLAASAGWIAQPFLRSLGAACWHWESVQPGLIWRLESKGLWATMDLTGWHCKVQLCLIRHRLWLFGVFQHCNAFMRRVLHEVVDA